MEKKVIIIIAMIVLFSCISLQSGFVERVKAVPATPMVIYGSINDTGGKNIDVGVSVKAHVIDPLYPSDVWFNHTTALNETTGLVGFGHVYQDGVEFVINDSDPPSREGNIVEFYIDNDYWGNFTFVSEQVPMNITLTDIPEILFVNSSDSGTAGNPYTVNVTATDLFDVASEMRVKVNWSHGSLTDNTSLSSIGGDNFSGSFTLDDATSVLTYTVWVNDTAGNLNSSGPHAVIVNDVSAPNSNVDPIANYWFNSSSNPLVITATASDDVGLKNVSLYYYHSTDNASFSGPFLFDTDSDPWVDVSWSFSFPNTSGYYRFYSVAIDNASISESAPLTNDTNCGYDTDRPGSTISIPVDGSYYKTSDAIDTNITGTANDALSGINYVNITIYNSADETYWTGTAWQEDVAWLNTNGTTTWYNNSALPIWVHDKTYYINSTAVDTAGNIESSSDSNSFTYDTIDPSAPTYNDDENQWYTSNPTLDIDFEDGVALASVEYKIDTGGTYTTLDSGIAGKTYTDNWQIDSSVWNEMSNGTHYLYFKITDDAGNVYETDSNEAGFTIKKDTDTPSSTIVLPENNAYYTIGSSIDSNITGTVGDSTSETSHVNITIYNSTTGKYWTGSTWQESVSWLNTTIITDESKTWYNNSGLPIWTNGTVYIINSTATDNAGNEQTTPDSNSFTYDTAQPSTNITLPVDGAYYKSGDAIDTNITGTATDALSDVDHVNITIYNSTDGTYWTGATWQENVAWLETNGTTTWYNDSGLPTWTSGKTYTVNSSATDDAGNIEATDSNSFIYDSNQPSSTITLPNNEAYYKTGDAIDSNITGTADDALSGIDHVNITIYNSTDGTYWTGATWQETVAWLNTNGTTTWYNNSALPIWVHDKTYYINSTAVDTAGNIESSSDSNSFTYDTIDPSAPTYNDDENQWYTSNPTLDIDFEDGVALASVEYKIDTGGTYTTLDSGIAGKTYTDNWQIDSSVWNEMSNGTHYLYFKITDDAGNQYETSSDEAGFKFKKDDSNPNSEITIPADEEYYAAGSAIDTNISGTASNGESGVNHVNITIYNSTDASYWTGTTWQEDIAWLNTNGTTTWYNNSGLPTWIHNKTYYVNSTAVDTAGNIEIIPDSKNFTYDTINPNSTIVTPSDDVELDTLSNITGTASDTTAGIQFVNITIYNSTDGEYWDGTAWQESVAWLETNGTTTWYNDSGLPTWTNEKTYTINSTAVDNAGNIQNSTESNSFTFDTSGDDDDDGPGSNNGPSGGGFAPPGDQTAPSAPENVSCISVIVDTTPSFTWSAATDNEGVEGYYVKIDDGSEIAVGNVLNWTADTVSDGSYVFYVRAEDAAGNSGPYGNCSFTVNTSTASSMIPVADAGGPYSTALTNSSLLFDGSASFDPDGEIVNYSWDFGNGERQFGSSVNYRYNSSGDYNVTLTVMDDDGLMDDDTVMITILLDTDGDGWSDEVEQSYNSDDDDPFDGPLDSDGDGIPDDDSADGKYLGDTDDDNDGVSDSVEEQFGSDPQNESDVSGVTIENRTYYLIDADGDGVFDGAYLNEENDVSITKNNDNYLIDTDGDGTWDYEYDETLGEVTEYEEETKPSGGIPWLFVIIGTIAVIISILLILIKMGYISIKMG